MKDVHHPRQVILDDAGAMLSGVADADLDAAVTRRMLTAIYRLSVLLVVLPLTAGVLAYAYYVEHGWILVPIILGTIALGAVLLVALRLVLGFARALLGFLDQLTQLPAAVLSLNAEVSQLHGGVAELRDGVGGLRGDVNSLKESLDTVQFWRAPSRMFKSSAERPPREDD